MKSLAKITLPLAILFAAMQPVHAESEGPRMQQQSQQQTKQQLQNQNMFATPGTHQVKQQSQIKNQYQYQNQYNNSHSYQGSQGGMGTGGGSQFKGSKR
ncbi:MULTISPECIES: hypothetical protein [Thiomicrorhabdus]|uniref:DUF2756 domain-containing protein n=1 Tax=Thiomicrorhabdus heinhorstiae TaxID=2748010 RepID=A0ABS0BWQ7_9GAMM|nr:MULTISPECIES: hypothetical protein [Thiomicrorhabdus]MBF6058243.1 hypothetical protein [Thiomicrorhabdus heinhorstiae]